MGIVVYRKVKTIYSYKRHTQRRARPGTPNPHVVPALVPVVVVGAPGIFSMSHTYHPCVHLVLTEFA